MRLADRAVCIGPPPPGESYLNIASVVAAGNTTGCEAVHPGYGFLAERPEFVEACVDNDLVFIGPDAEGDGADGRQGGGEGSDARGRRPARPGHRGGDDARAGDRSSPRRSAFPVLLKAAAGGGGRGMRLVHSADELETAYATASGEARGCLRRRQPLPREGASFPRGTSRSRCSPTATAACSRSASASARSSAATRSSSRSRRRRR